MIDDWQRRFEAGELPRDRFIVDLALALERVDMTIGRGTDAELSDLREVVEVAWALLNDEPPDEEGLKVLLPMMISLLGRWRVSRSS
ncbi:MAG: hypothetical protein R3F20_09115 [Planctomycetota bacterium]